MSKPLVSRSRAAIRTESVRPVVSLPYPDQWNPLNGNPPPGSRLFLMLVLPATDLIPRISDAVRMWPCIVEVMTDLPTICILPVATVDRQRMTADEPASSGKSRFLRECTGEWCTQYDFSGRSSGSPVSGPATAGASDFRW